MFDAIVRGLGLNEKKFTQGETNRFGLFEGADDRANLGAVPIANS
jgi:hypothetical protein